MMDLSSIPPQPWTPVKVFENGWGYTVLAADGQNIAAHEVWDDDAALMATLHAFAPRAMAYVIASAEKGGLEAKRIVADFERARANVSKTPEQITALRRGAR
jgi:hypothetical protein